MATFLLISAAGFYFLHLALETLASFVKYNFSSLGHHMQGVSLSNIFAITSRGAVAAYGILLAFIIEREFSSASLYSTIFFATLLFGSAFSLFLSKLKLSTAIFNDKELQWDKILRNPRDFFEANNACCNITIRGVSAIMLGAQFVATVIAYGLCFTYPQHRLIIISLVPLISMMGTLTQILMVEPRLAKMIDRSNDSGYAASREFLRARALSFFICGCALLAMPVMFSLLQRQS